MTRLTNDIKTQLEKMDFMLEIELFQKNVYLSTKDSLLTFHFVVSYIRDLLSE